MICATVSINGEPTRNLHDVEVALDMLSGFENGVLTHIRLDVDTTVALFACAKQ